MPITKDDTRRSAVYRLYSETGQLLYIGATIDPEARWNNLESVESWWELVSDKTVTWYDRGAEALEVETAAIKAEKPLFNLVGSGHPKDSGHLRRLHLADGRILPVYRGSDWLIGYGEIADEREQDRLRALARTRKRPTEVEVQVDEEWAGELAAAGFADEAARAYGVAVKSRLRRDAAFGVPRPESTANLASEGEWKLLAKSCDHAEGECPAA